MDHLFFKIIKILIILAFFSCKDEKEITLVYSPKDSLMKDSIQYINKLKILYDNDTLIIKRFYDKRVIESDYYKKGNSVWTSLRKYLQEDSFDNVIIMSIIDTCYTWNKNDEIFPFIIGFNNTNSKYKIKRIGYDSYTTTIQSLIDSTYFERYYYNSKFILSKLEYTYKQNKYVYLPLKER